MRRRQRMTWYDREKLAATRARRRRASRRKFADPYTMNQDRVQPAIDAYQTGDPSSWGEAVHRGYPRDSEVGRNEVGMPNPSHWDTSHKGLDTWGAGTAPYDNADTFTAEDLEWGTQPRNRRTVQEREASRRRMYASIEKKAYQCVRIAADLLPGADEEEIEEQALDLMDLPDEAVEATAFRLAARRLAEEAEAEEEEEDAEVEAMLRQMLAEEEEDEEEEEEEDAEVEDEDEDTTEVEAKVASILRKILAEAEEEEEEEEEEEDDIEAEVEARVASRLRKLLAEAEEAEAEEEEEEEDAEVEAMVREMMALANEDDEAETEDDEDDQQESGDLEEEEDFEVELEPTLNEVAANETHKDEVLRGLFANTVPKGATKKASKKARGVRSLGGRVKEAANGEEGIDLSKLWASDPDVSDIF